MLSGNARAAELSYDDYVAQVKAGKLDIDYTAFRMAYVASPKYEPYGAARVLMGQMKKAYTAGDCPAAMAHAKEIFEVNLVQIDAHFVTALCQRKADNEEEARREHAMLMGLVRSVLGSRACLHRALWLPDPSHMGEAKTAGIFQAVAERAVEADMGQPDHGDRERQRREIRKPREIPDSFKLAIEMETAARRCPKAP